VVRTQTSGVEVFGCKTSTEVASMYGGGIIGRYANQSNKYLLIDSCSCEADVSGRYGGGIAGGEAINFTIQNCSYKGDHTNRNTAGICYRA
jgi:hypothetical protein